MQSILVINAGSSSVKFQVFKTDETNNPEPFIRGEVSGIGTKPWLYARDARNTTLIDVSYDSASISDVATAMHAAGDWLRDTQQLDLVAIGHRVVHGGPEFSGPTIVDRKILTRLERYVSLAPLHQPNNLAPIRTLLERFPSLPQVACFDTAFHRGHNALADHYAIPERFYAEGVRRYGFHGLSYEYVSGRFREMEPKLADRRVIIAHLGSGASMCALLKGHSIESTIGFTALDGLPMGTRPGQLDPGIVLYLISEKGMSAAEVQKLLYQECGLKGLSGISNDVRELLESADPSATLALSYFVYRIGLNAGMLAAALGGLDAFIFTAGIGEKSPLLRARISEKLAWLGAELNPVANDSGKTKISQQSSKVSIHVIPTNEELMIANQTWRLLLAKRQHDDEYKRSA
jgi:acetate kinase